MKVTRQNINENYNITSGWVGEFAKSLEKNADFLSNVKGVFKKRNAPKTIEEKMADIKQRVGYGIIKADNLAGPSNIKEAGDCSTCCSGCESGASCSTEATSKDREELIRLMSQLLDYIKDFLTDRPELSTGAIIDHCRRHPELSWNILSPKMDHNKLNNFINSKIKDRSCGNEMVKYISYDTTGSEPEDTTPEFMRGPSL